MQGPGLSRTDELSGGGSRTARFLAHAADAAIAAPDDSGANSGELERDTQQEQPPEALVPEPVSEEEEGEVLAGNKSVATLHVVPHALHPQMPPLAAQAAPEEGAVQHAQEVHETHKHEGRSLLSAAARKAKQAARGMASRAKALLLTPGSGHAGARSTHQHQEGARDDGPAFALVERAGAPGAELGKQVVEQQLAPQQQNEEEEEEDAGGALGSSDVGAWCVVPAPGHLGVGTPAPGTSSASAAKQTGQAIGEGARRWAAEDGRAGSLAGDSSTFDEDARLTGTAFSTTWDAVVQAAWGAGQAVSPAKSLRHAKEVVEQVQHALYETPDAAAEVAGSIMGRHLQSGAGQHAAASHREPRKRPRATPGLQRASTTGAPLLPEAEAAAAGRSVPGTSENVSAAGTGTSRVWQGLRRAWSWGATQTRWALAAAPGLVVDVEPSAAELPPPRGLGRAAGAAQGRRSGPQQWLEEDEQDGAWEEGDASDESAYELGEGEKDEPCAASHAVAATSAEALVEGLRNASQTLRHPHTAASELAGRLMGKDNYHHDER